MTKKTKKLVEEQEMDSEQLRRAYIEYYGPCDNCGSEDLGFLDNDKVKCNSCGIEWELTKIPDDTKENKVERFLEFFRVG